MPDRILGRLIGIGIVIGPLGLAGLVVTAAVVAIAVKVWFF